MKLKKIILSLFLSALFFGNSTFASEHKVTFEKAELILGKKTISVELAVTREQLSYGLMNRTSLPENSGMLFMFSNEEIKSFWMKNTFVDLSIGFFDKKQKLVDIQDMVAVKSVMEEPKSYISKYPAKYALEVPKGWFAKNKINLGDNFRLTTANLPRSSKN